MAIQESGDDAARYPRVNEPLLPRALVAVLSLPSTLENLPTNEGIDWSERSWRLYPPWTCKALAREALSALKGALRDPAWTVDIDLPPPDDVLRTYRIEPRTRGVLSRALNRMSVQGRWTARRYLDLHGFGPQRLLDLLLAAEVREPPPPSDHAVTSVRGTNGEAGVPRRLPEIHFVKKALLLIEARIPTTLRALEEALSRIDIFHPGVTLELIEEALTHLGKRARFERVRVGHTDLVLPKGGTVLARLSHATACRYMHETGIGNVDSVAVRVRAITGLNSKRLAAEEVFRPAVFSVEEALRHLPSFAWLDRPRGWFWLTDCYCALKPRLLKALLAAGEIDLETLRDHLFGPEVVPRPSVAAIRALAASLPALTLTSKGDRTLVRFAIGPSAGR